MKFTCILSLCWFFLLCPATTTGQWNYINPPLTRSHLVDIVFTDDQHGFSVGYDGMLLRTTDSGTTWDTLRIDVNTRFTCIYFSDELTGYIGTENHGYFHSGDGGNSWNFIPVPGMRYIRDILYTDPQTGFIVGSDDDCIMKTVDGGVTWQNVFTASLCPAFRSIDFINSQTGYAVGGVSAVYKTTNGGLSWTSIPWTGGGQWYFRDVHFFSESTGLMAWENGIFRTTDGGINWTLVYNSPGSYNGVSKLLFPDAQIGYACGPAGIFLRTIDGGITWTETAVPSPRGFSSMWQISDGSLFACANGGAVLKSIDSGTNWNFLTTLTNADFNAIYTQTDGTAFLCGEYGVLLKSVDWGQNWYHTNSNTTRVLMSVCFPEPSTGYAVGGAGMILKSMDHGENWFHLAIDSGYSWMAVCFTDPLTGYVAGTNGKIKKTTDGGTTWLEANINAPYSAALYAIDFPALDTGYASGYNGILLKTIDAGVHWNMASPFFQTSYLFSMDFLTGQKGHVTGNNGPCSYKTVDGGQSWSWTGEYGEWYSVHFSDQMNGNVSGEYGKVAKTVNGGGDWKSAYITDWYTQLRTIRFFTADSGLVAGSNGTIMRTVNGGVVTSDGNPAHAGGLKITPNPGRGVFHVHFPSPAIDETIGVYTLMGQKVKDIYPVPGSSTALLDLGNFPDGIYVVSMTSVKRQVCKALLIKYGDAASGL